MTTPPAVPQAALTAATADVQDRIHCTTLGAERIVRGAIAAALPHLLPGLFVAPDPRGTPTIWRQVNDLAWPVPALSRTQDNADLFDAIAALLPRED